MTNFLRMKFMIRTFLANIIQKWRMHKLKVGGYDIDSSTTLERNLLKFRK